MRWFRIHIGFGARLALYAMAVQLVLSFGHIHVGKLVSASSQASVALVQAPTQDRGPSPTPHSGANDFCAICATVSLLAGSVLPTASSLLPPVTSEHRWLTAFVSTKLSFDPFILFQARAPPVVL